MSVRTSIFNPDLPLASSVPRSSTSTPTPTTNPNSPSTSDYHTAASASHILSDDDDEEFYGGSSGGENTRHRWGDTEDTKTSVKPFFGIIRALDWDSHQNIGNHLLQAHVLKKLHPHGAFMSQEWKGKKGQDLDDDKVVDPAIANRKRFITKQWTAWPLPAHRVPREKEHLPGNVFFQQRRRINDQKTFAKRQEGKQAPSEMLEQVLTAVVLRKAKERIRVRNNPALKPAYDDEESERLVKPVVRDVIARLDTLLLGLHQEREHYVKRLIPSTEGGDSKRKWDRVKIMPKLGDELPTSPDTTAARPMPDRSDSEEERVPKKKKRNIATPEEYAVRLKDRMTMLTLRDWSHVMGMAAIKGWDQEPLQKAAKECVELFDRDMKFRTLGIGAGNAGRTGIVWSAKEGLREDPSSFKEEGNYLEPVKVSWGGKKRRAQEAKERRRRKLEEVMRKAREEEDEEDEERNGNSDGDEGGEGGEGGNNSDGDGTMR